MMRWGGAVQGIRVQEELSWWEDGQRKAAPARPHKLVALKLSSCSLPTIMQCIQTPRQFPRKKPVGCARAPIAPPQGYTQASGSQRQEEGQESALDMAWKKLTSCMELELCGVSDLFKKGEPDGRWMGRGGKLKLVGRQTMPRRAAADLGRLKQNQYAYVWCQLRLQGMQALAIKATAAGALTEAQMDQWHALVRKFCSPSAPARFDAEDCLLEEACAGLQAFYMRPEGAQELLGRALDHVTRRIKENKQADDKAARGAWRAWLAQQMRGGAASGAAHCFAKRVEADPDLLIRYSAGLSAAPQDVVQADLEEWNKVWKALEGRSAAPWRSEGMKCEGAPRRKIRVKDIRKVARSFKERTGIGIDGIAPNQLDWMSDVLLERTIELLEAIEEKGAWPGAVATALMHLIPKAQGGRRPIALVATVVRIWVKCRKREVEAWKETCRRHYDWMGRGKGAEKAIWAQSVQEEAMAQRKEGHRIGAL